MAQTIACPIGANEPRMTMAGLALDHYLAGADYEHRNIAVRSAIDKC